MGIQGVAFSPEASDIIDALKRHRGVLSCVAREFDCSRQCLYLYFEKHPEIKSYVDILRKDYVESMVDAAENTVDVLLRKTEEQPAVALKAAQFVLNNQAKSRGYAHPDIETMERGIGMLDKVQSLSIRAAKEADKLSQTLAQNNNGNT